MSITADKYSEMPLKSKWCEPMWDSFFNFRFFIFRFYPIFHVKKKWKAKSKPLWSRLSPPRRKDVSSPYSWSRPLRRHLTGRNIQTAQETSNSRILARIAPISTKKQRIHRSDETLSFRKVFHAIRVDFKWLRKMFRARCCLNIITIPVLGF